MTHFDSVEQPTGLFEIDPVPEYSEEEKSMRRRLQDDIRAYLEAGNTIIHVDSAEMKKIKGSDKLTYREWNQFC